MLGGFQSEFEINAAGGAGPGGRIHSAVQVGTLPGTKGMAAVKVTAESCRSE